MPIKPRHVPLGIFLAASVLVHTLVLVRQHVSDIQLSAQTQQLTGGALHIKLRHEEPSTQTVEKTRALHAHVSSVPRATISAAAHTDRQTTKLANPARSLATNAPVRDTSTANNTEAKAQVLSRVREDFDQHFYYPMLARRHGWQGQVLLGFSVAANGRIHGVHVQRGSGYPILDESAQAALNRIPQLHQVQRWLQGNSMQLQLSVVYRLQGG